MRRLVRLVAKLYPPRWRQRYGSEFDALLEEVEPRWPDLFNVLKGALEMQVRTAVMIPVACAAFGAFAGGFVALGSPIGYASQAIVRLDLADVPGGTTAAVRDDVMMKSFKDATREYSRAHIRATRVSLVPIPDAATPTSTTLFTVSFVDPDPTMAQRMVVDLVNHLTASASAVVRADRVAGVPTEGPRFEMIEPPTRPQSPMRRPGYLAVAWCAIGLAVGAIGFWLLSAVRPRMA